MAKKYYIGIAVLICVLLGVGWYVMQRSNRAPKSPYDEMVLYYGTECPHCKDLDKFIAQHSVDGKVSFTEKEVFHNRKNLMELIQRMSMAGMRPDVIEVPILWTGSKCVVGMVKISAFFKEKLDAK